MPLNGMLETINNGAIVMLRPYLKFLIAGGVVSGEGGSVLVSGLELLWINPLMNSMLNSLSSMTSITGPTSTIITWEGIGYMVAGIISLAIGLPLLFMGISRRKQYITTHPSGQTAGLAKTAGREALERPYLPENRGSPASEPFTTHDTISSNGTMNRRCQNCGVPLPDLADTRFCPNCGQRL